MTLTNVLSRRKDQRQGKRAPARVAALIRVDDNSLGIPCIVWDISHGGAKLAASRPGLVPEHFTLELSRTDHRRCQRRWRSKRFIATKFVDS
jgi:hypothetical protein